MCTPTPAVLETSSYVRSVELVQSESCFVPAPPSEGETRYVSLSVAGSVEDVRFVVYGLRSLFLASAHRNLQWVVYLSGPSMLRAGVAQLVVDLAEQVRRQGVQIEFRGTDWTSTTCKYEFMDEPSAAVNRRRT
jgi:hypothetical protein